MEWITDLLSVVLILWGFPGSSDGKKPACSAGNLNQEDPLEKGMVIHYSILARRIPERVAWWATVLLL